MEQKFAAIHGTSVSAESQLASGWNYTARPAAIEMQSPQKSRKLAVVPTAYPSLRTISAMHSLDARERPLGRLSHNRIVARREFLQRTANVVVSRCARFQARVPCGDAGVAQQAAPFGPFDRASAKDLAKIGFTEIQKPFEPGKKKRIV